MNLIISSARNCLERNTIDDCLCRVSFGCCWTLWRQEGWGKIISSAAVYKKERKLVLFTLMDIQRQEP